MTNESLGGEPVSGESAGAARGKRHVRLGAVVIAIVAVISLILFVDVWRRPPPLELAPLPDLGNSPPAIRELVGDAYADVIRHPDSGRLWGRLGMVYFSHQFEWESIACFERAATLDDDEPRWPYFAGLALSSTDADAAADRFRLVLQKAPRNGVVHVRLGEILLNQHQITDAESHFDSAISVSPRDVRARLGKARCRLLEGDLAAAKKEVIAAGNLDSDVREIHELLAIIERRLGNDRDADAASAKSAQLRSRDLGWDDPWAAEVMSLRRDAGWALRQAEELQQASRLVEAIDVLRNAIAADDRDPDVYARLAQYLVQAGRVAESKSLLEAGRKRHAGSAEILFQSGVAAFLTNDYSSAERYFELTLQQNADYPLAYYNLGHVHLKLQRPEDAFKDFESAVRLRPDYADAHANIGQILLAKNQIDEARRHLEKAVALAPGNVWARRLLDRANSP